jgi:putative oxidoreductase
MKIATHIARVLLGLLFFVFGLNGLHPFIPTGPMPGGLAGQFMTVFFQSHWVLFVAFFQTLSGALLLVNRFVPLALAILGPVIVNILLFHALLLHMGWQIGALAAIFWIFLFIRNWQSFKSLFVVKTA